MKKITAVFLAILMMFSVIGTTAFAGSVDDEIKDNASDLIDGVIGENDAIVKLLAAFQKIIDFFTPEVTTEKAAVNNVTIVNSYDDGNPFVAKFSLTTDLNFNNLKVGVNAFYEYRTLSADGQSWSNWSTVKDGNGKNVAYNRLSFGVLRSADGSTRYNYWFTNRIASAGTEIGIYGAKSDFASIANLADGTIYEMRVILSINNGFDVTDYTSGNFSFER